jgi:hypothetical protein
MTNVLARRRSGGWSAWKLQPRGQRIRCVTYNSFALKQRALARQRRRDLFACKMGLESIVSNPLSAPYVPARDWITVNRGHAGARIEGVRHALRSAIAG